MAAVAARRVRAPLSLPSAWGAGGVAPCGAGWVNQAAQQKLNAQLTRTWWCACRKSHPCRLSGMPVLVEDATEAIASVYVEAAGGSRPGDRWGQRTQRPGVRDSLVRPVGIVELLELAQGVQQVRLVPDQGTVKQLAAAGLHPALHDRVAPHRQLRPIRTIGT